MLGLGTRSASEEGEAILNLPRIQRDGLIAISILATISLIATSSLLVFFTYRMIFWTKYYKRYIGYNQFVVLIYNLILADFLQGLGFIISLRWIATNSVKASDPACFLQGIWLQVGDPMSGLFVLAIAVHTFLSVSMGYQLEHRIFVASIVGLWVFGVLMVIIPIATYGRYVWYPAVAWCWMTPKYEAMRLWTHYFWIFAAQFFTIVLYAIMFFQLRTKIAESAILGQRNSESLRRLKKVIAHMAMYPIVYIIVSLPLAAGRMASAHGDSPSVVYFCVAGSFMACSGTCDALMYTLTRRSIVLEPEAKDENSYPNNTSAKKSYGGTMDDKTATSTANAVKGGVFSRTRSDSTEEMIGKGDVELAPMGMVYQHTTIEVTHEPAYPDDSNGNARVNRRDFHDFN
ncbi:hypothetical protein ASPWEDRAFT_100207 [Aspergillus wentii DTO 134E9]|uniref:G protein-coupled receptor GPR1/2/3 C-terminal domain-containing protein n=1 Tax=Aspergillus wentii DTO 134E9 TaxID=1073089 RepID=A0A1L9S2U2_ASPWE|nr:uncharacterized protein ASPWEDRAFT_100207 [Aspergillus wentii DTO 134E9]KAI9929831.1 hypothetical protein MW887_011637 [Aspergillus wentii]OJJ41482.1 hypothetical protein ASPWEDRAFT_100207 [Aspergillus wentii DTO 134E9]